MARKVVVHAEMSELAYAKLEPKKQRFLGSAERRIQALVQKMECAVFKRLRAQRRKPVPSSIAQQKAD